jgi:hypothetical protein
MLVPIMGRKTRYTLSSGINKFHTFNGLPVTSHPESVHRLEYEHVRVALKVRLDILKSFVSYRPLLSIIKQLLWCTEVSHKRSAIVILLITVI